MEDFRSNPSSKPPLHPFRSLLVLLGFVLLGMSLGGLLAGLFLGAWASTNGSKTAADMADILTNPADYPGSWNLLMLIQAVSHLCSFLLPCLLFQRWIEHRTWSDFNDRRLSAVHSVGLVALLTITFMPLNGLIIEWNQNIDLPDSFAGLEEWMKQKEDQMAGLTNFLTNFTSPIELVMALIVIGLIPGIGEEVLFRGMLQRKLAQWTGNVHVAIWLSALIFSAIHVQFYGFVPRALLGALFGYLYLWSGNIWVPILAHAVNNSFTVLMVWLFHRRMISVDIENTESVPLTGALISLLLTIGFLAFFRKSNQSPSQPYV
ncbi:CPBP family intramembrane glutamic endopeptidase [Larkinella terrae]|uniref:CPBP family intramembrane metalloprotease n=1 Tax=Larkinella terrae TaxID=2025311 RepID=A0A7K0EJ61_9BACT|nr:CPBP family intramembrane glutamic endopeptidase [Larkinella terrae]MRS61591.1 CPBP family intramembrane metalloprotease [Larkinella terrae]